MNFEMVFAFFVYLFFLLLISILVSKKMRRIEKASSGSEFLLGGRSINYWVTAISAHASDMSDWLFMAFPAVVFTNGLSEVWIAVSLVIGMFMSWHFVAPKLRTITEKLGCYTLASYFEKRFNETSGVLNLLVALVVGFFMTVYLAAGIKGVGYLLKSCFGINYHIGTLISIIAIVFYTLIGGFLAVSWIDFFQGLFLLCVIVGVPLVAIFNLGGFSKVYSELLPKLSFVGSVITARSFLEVLLDPIGWGLGYFGMPHILGKFMAAKNANEMYKSKYIGIVWQILALGAAIAVGFVGTIYFKNGLAVPEMVFIEMVKGLFIPFIAGIILCGILAATLSTMDSQVLVFAGIIAQDFYKGLFNKNASKKQILAVYKISIILVCILAYFLAYDEHGTIMSLVKYAWSGLGASFAPLVLVSLYSKNVNKYGAISGILIGGFVAAIWRFLNISPFGITISEIVPGFFASLISIFLISFGTKKIGKKS